MAVTLEHFRAQFPEFGKLTDEHVTAHLDASVAITTVNLGSVYEQVVLWKTADSLARTQWGYNANLKSPGEMSSYGVHLRELLQSAPLRVMAVHEDMTRG